MEQVRLIEYHWSVNVPLGPDYINYRAERETRWFVERILWKRFLWIFWFPLVSQKIRKDTNQAISSACLGDRYTYDLHWKKKLLGKPIKINYR